MWLTILFWDWIPVRIVFGAFCLIMLDLYLKARKWDAEDKKREQDKQERIKRLRKLERGEHLYLDNEPWYLEMQGIKVERETSPPNLSQDSIQNSNPNSSESNVPKPKSKRKCILNKLKFLYECRCLYKESVKIVTEARKGVNADMKSNNKRPKNLKYHRRD